MNQSQQTTALRVRRASEIEASGDPAVAADRYLIEIWTPADWWRLSST